MGKIVYEELDPVQPLHLYSSSSEFLYNVFSFTPVPGLTLKSKLECCQIS
jgi:hypothetical protein